MASRLEDAQKLKVQYEAALDAAKQEYLDKITDKKKELKALETEFEKLYGSAPKQRRKRRTKAEIEAGKVKGKAVKASKPKSKKVVVKKPANKNQTTK